jgi:curved DNA-binding protein CbpA
MWTGYLTRLDSDLIYAHTEVISGPDKRERGEAGMSERDPYQVLGIGPGATGTEIARAYRRLARALHPDSRPGDPAAAGQFRALSDAYLLLSDPARRAAYDHRQAPRPGKRPLPPRPAGPRPGPFQPAAQLRAAGVQVHGATVRAGPVHIQPPGPAGGGDQPSPGADPALSELLWLLRGGGREHSW